jgi:hypothetical protein
MNWSLDLETTQLTFRSLGNKVSLRAGVLASNKRLGSWATSGKAYYHSIMVF